MTALKIAALGLAAILLACAPAGAARGPQPGNVLALAHKRQHAAAAVFYCRLLEAGATPADRAQEQRLAGCK